MKNKDYIQPDFYHFSQDSTQFSHYLLKLNLKDQKILELCAGSGVIGIEYAKKRRSVKEINFVELQDDFIPKLKKNISSFLSNDIEVTVSHYSFEEVEIEAYDLVFFNPPFFEKKSGRMPKDIRKEKCHFMTEEKFELLIKLSYKLMNLGARVYFLNRIDNSWLKKNMKKYRIQEVHNMGKTSIFTLGKIQ